MTRRSSSVELQKLDPISLQKLRDIPPPLHILRKVQSALSNTSDPKIDDYHPTTKPFKGYVSPLDPYLLIWDIIVMITMYVFFFELGFIIGFTAQFWINNKTQTFTWIQYSIILIIFVIDIFINFHKGFYKVGEGHIIMKRQQIVKKYLKKLFIVDVISLICVILPLITSSAWNSIQMLFLLKYLKKRSYQRQIKRGFEQRPHLTLTFMLVVLMIDAILISHYVAVIFLRIDTALWNSQYYGDNQSLYWLSNNADYSVNLIGGAWYLQYIYAQDYAAGTLSTLAPGPFPKNPLQVIYANFIMVFLIILSSFLADGIVRIFYWQNQKRQLHESKIQSFLSFLQQKKVTPNVKYKTQNYFQLIWETQGKVDKNAQQSAISKLSSKLKRQLMLEIMNFRYLKFVSYFKQYQKQLQEQLIPKIQSMMTDADQLLFSPQTDDIVEHNHQIFVISNGQAKLFISNSKNQQFILGLTNTEKVMGVYQFITQQNYCYSAKTIHITHYHSLFRKDFMSIINKLQLKQMYIQLLYKIQVQRKLDVIGKCCSVCIGHHLQKDCPSIIFSKRIQSIIAKQGLYTSIPQHQRKQIKRSNIKNKLIIKNNELFALNPFGIFNGKLFDHYINQLLVFDSNDIIDKCENFDMFYPQWNIQKLI